MSLTPSIIELVPDQTILVARAAFPKGNLYLSMRDELGIFLRQVFGWHTTFLVNSATHLWGKRRFETHEDSRNNGLIAALTFGEGWHNNHHAHPLRFCWWMAESVLFSCLTPKPSS